MPISNRDQGTLMARPALPIGTWGRIRREQIGARSWRARARFRDYDGVTREVEAHNTTAAKAENKLRVMLRDRSTPSGDDITPDTRIRQLADLWLEEITATGRIVQQTIDRYRACLDQAIRKALGELRIREASVGRVDKFFKSLARKHPAQARNAKTILSQMFALAVRHGALTTNPVRDVAALPSRRRTVKALQLADLDTVRDAIRRWQEPTPGKSGPRHSNDLADVVDLLLATGARIGEILALRWHDLDLTGLEPTVTISGTLVFVKGHGLFRQDWTKSDAGFRTVILPQFAVDMLVRRHAADTGNDHDAVFCSRKGTWLYPNNVRRQWRQARQDTGLDWVTPHTFRKTVATLLDREGERDAATAQLGHSSDEVTKTYYIEKATQAPNVTDILDQLGRTQPRTATEHPATTMSSTRIPTSTRPSVRLRPRPSAKRRNRRSFTQKRNP
jgi:integrase